MKCLMRSAALFLCLLAVALPASADEAKSFYKKGRDAEARQDYIAAYENYREAYDRKPKELRYRSAYQRTRFLAGAAHVNKGQRLREEGKLEEALAEFQAAASIDPASFVAQQEIRRTQQMMEGNKTGAPQATAPQLPSSIRKRLEEAQGPAELAPIQNLPITLKLTEDTKVIYETVGKLAGINVLFDPDYTSRRIRIELNSVTLDEALEIIALESKTFWRPVTQNTIFIAADTPAKRKEVEQSVIKTFYLSNVSTPTELQDMVNAMRSILEVSRIQQLPTQNAIVVRGTPDQIALAQKLISDLDRAKSEVIVEVAVMQVSRDKIRNLGLSPPTSASVALQPNVTNSTTGSSSGTPTTSGSSGSINLNRLGNLDARDFTVTIPPASVTALFSDSNTKLIQNPQIRALDGQKASLKIGDRVPVATGSFQPGIGGVGINPLVNTQFQYIDVGVNIDITPRVHANREVTLKLALDISSVTSRVNIGGIDQPVIGQRKVEHEIRLREGEVNLLGGILEDQDVKSLSGLPGLAQIPLLKYFFSQTNTEHRENEIVFALVPHIVRGQELSDLNQQALDVGTANAIELRRMSRPAQAQPTPQPQQAQQPAPQAVAPPPVQPQAVPNQPPAQPAAAPSNASFQFDPANVTQAQGSTFTVNVTIAGAQNVYAVPIQLLYDPRMLQLVNVSNGGFLGQDGQAVALVHRDDATSGTLQMSATRPPGAGGISGSGTVFTLTFAAKAAGRSSISINQGGAKDPGMQPIQVAGAQAVVTVQ
jgi:general secretion pathway protein D